MGKHGHGDEHPSELRHDLPPMTPQHSSHDHEDPLNFSRKHPLFNLEFQKKGPEFSEVDERRLDYIQKYAGKVPDTEIEVPRNIQGTSGTSQDW
jgi:hypothetical protein